MGEGGCVYAPVASLPYKICSVLLKSVERPAWLTTANSFSELNPDQIIFLWLPLYCNNRDGFEYYTTRQLQYTIRSGFFLRILSCWKRKSLSVKWMLMVGLLFIINWQTPLNLCLWNYLQLLPRLFFLTFLQWLVLTFFNLLQNALRFLVISPHFLLITKTILRLERSRKRHTVLVTMCQSKWKKNVASSKLKMDCYCRKMSLLFCRFLSAVDSSKQDFCKFFLALSLITNTLWMAWLLMWRC